MQLGWVEFGGQSLLLAAGTVLGLEVVKSDAERQKRSSKGISELVLT